MNQAKRRALHNATAAKAAALARAEKLNENRVEGGVHPRAAGWHTTSTSSAAPSRTLMIRRVDGNNNSEFSSCKRLALTISFGLFAPCITTVFTYLYIDLINSDKKRGQQTTFYKLVELINNLNEHVPYAFYLILFMMTAGLSLKIGHLWMNKKISTNTYWLAIMLLTWTPMLLIRR